MKLKIEGKLKDGFFEWLQKIEQPIWQLDGEDSEGMYIYLYPSVVFDELPQSAQFGLLQEYAECVLDRLVFLKWIEDFVIYYKLHNYDMPLTRVEATKKLNEIVNHD